MSTAGSASPSPADNVTAFRSRPKAGLVLTGGGAKMEGAIELAEEVFNMPVRLGIPQHVTGLLDVVRNPVYATGVGLLLVGSQNARGAGPRRSRTESPGNVWERMRAWFQTNF